MATLPRLLNRETEVSARWTAFDATIGSFEHAGAPLLDPWRVVLSTAAKNEQGLKRALDWLYIFAYSGVDIPSSTFIQMSVLLRESQASFEDSSKLCKAVFAAICVKSMGRQELQEVIVDFYDRNAPYILEKVNGCGTRDVL